MVCAQRSVKRKKLDIWNVEIELFCCQACQQQCNLYPSLTNNFSIYDWLVHASLVKDLLLTLDYH